MTSHAATPHFVRRTRSFTILPILMLAMMAGALDANAAVISTFDTDADGWTGMTFTNKGVFLNSTLPGFNYHAADGNPGGYISTLDPGPSEAARLGAPSKFLGNQSAMLGGALAFDLTIDRSGQVDQNPPPLLLIQNGTNSLLFINSPVPSVGGWTSYVVPLAPQPPVTPLGAGWYSFIAGNSLATATAATQSNFDAVFANITHLSITGEFINDSVNLDTVGLDNVALSAVPLPATLPLLLFGLGGLAAARRRV